MSNSTLPNYSPAPERNTRGGASRPRVASRPAAPEPDELEVDEYDDQPAGLFASPARAITLVVALLMVIFIGVAIAWKLGEMSSTSGTASGNASTAGLTSGPKVGLLAPDFTLVDVKTNKAVTLSSLRGKPVWINFWGTWCPPCRAEMPEMQKIWDRRSGDVQILGISMGPRDEPAGVKQFVELNKYTWQFIHDPDSSIMNNYQVTGIPSSFFIDKNGVIRYIHVGGADAPTLEAGLQKALGSQ